MKLLKLCLLLSLVSCGFKSVENGNVAVVIDTFSKNVHEELATSGLQFKPLTNFVEVDATDVRVEMHDLQPKDKKGMKFEDVDLTVTVRLNKANAVTLYKETKEVTQVDHNGSQVLGYGKLVQVIKSSTMKAFQDFEYQEFMDDRTVLEKKIEEKVVQEIEKVMYNAYEVKDVASKTINLMPEIEKSFQNRSLVAQKRLLVKSEEQLMLERLEVEQKEMKKLREIAKMAGISVKELMDYKIAKERNEVLSDLSSGNTKVLVNLEENK